MTAPTTLATIAYKVEALSWLGRRLDWEDRLAQLRKQDTEHAEAVRDEARTAYRCEADLVTTP